MKDSNNIHKLVFLVEKYPEKTLNEIADMFSLPILDLKNSMWRAEKAEYLKIDYDEDKIEFLSKPPEYNFGVEVGRLIKNILYAMNKMGELEEDVEEHFFLRWFDGYPTQDTFVAINSLKDTGHLVTYEIEEDDSTYKFYTTPEHAHNKWGNKQFERRNNDEK